jgi:hypothetical protein
MEGRYMRMMLAPIPQAPEKKNGDKGAGQDSSN